jgi:ribonucleoside-diphosphate reductase alpha chain
LGDVMYHAGIRYGSIEGQEFSAQVMEFVRYHAMRTSVELAQERGPFPAIEGSIYDPANLHWTPPQALETFTRDWNRPEIRWDELLNNLQQHGIRNAAQTTVAPTGTIATVAGCEGYGCEPVFALAYVRHVNDNGKDLLLTYASPQFEKALIRANIPAETRQEIFDVVMKAGTCQGIPAVPEEIRRVFAVSGDISAEEHVRMQAAMQAFVDNSLSKTINFPAGATPEEVAQAYLLAWELGCKGITVYVTGSREKVVLETHATVEEKKQPAETQPETASELKAEQEELIIFNESKKPRPRSLPGYTYWIETPLGKAFITINENGGSQPFEVFVNTAKAGSDTAAVSEAIGRLISYTLRLASPIEPSRRLEEVIRQLAGIGGGRPLGFGPNRVRSLPDGIAQVIEEYIAGRKERIKRPAATNPTPSNGNGKAVKVERATETVKAPMLKIGDLCPECGQAAVVNEEGCRKCYSCGYSEC